ncbi:rhomboid family intramembrane serine protease [Bacillus sp. FJAT-49736]|uniref:rhomboid family protein n=1 Tax=Bacillus sp. FJAT-49736 TaxID=2833582 RepID=UPI001BC958BC|nr:rhomboid family intramembrane serine protease [Bacillus sp. FJAT-49736]MBS4173537.1 rhomboid family intramembrane serine protease [Bacillus sp. FJAT-49736]
MSGTQDFLFWRLAYFFIVEKKYRLIQISEDYQEIWLEDTSNKHAQIIRMLRYDLDWGNWLKRDAEHTCIQAEKLRKHFMKRSLNVLNIYVSTYAPVDDYEATIKHPLGINKGKTIVHNRLIESTNVEDGIQQVSSFMQDSISISLKEQYDEADVDYLRNTVLTNAVSQTQEEQQIFNNGKPFFTYILLGIQIIIFLILELMGGSSNTQNLIRFGAKSNLLIIEGQWWRFITPIFLHIGLLHLLMNSLALYYLGTAIERIYGRVRFLIIYLIAGFTGTLASFLFSSSVSAGASGAIFGCFGALLYLGAVYPKLFFRTMGTNVIIVIIINLIFGYSVSGVDNFGHIGGLIGGFLAAAIVHFPKKKRVAVQLGSFLLTLVLSAGFIYMGFHGGSYSTPNVINTLSQKKISDGEYGSAYKLLNDYVSKGKGNASTYFQLSYSEVHLKKYQEAKEHLLTAVKMEPNFAEAHFNLALLYLDEGNKEAARKEAQKAVELTDNEKFKNFLDQLNQSE